jgi:hypothetical protein
MPAIVAESMMSTLNNVHGAEIVEAITETKKLLQANRRVWMMRRCDRLKVEPKRSA